MDPIPDCVYGTWIWKGTDSHDPPQTYRVVNIPKVMVKEEWIRSNSYSKQKQNQVLLPVLSFKKDDEHSLGCGFVSVSLFSILFEGTLFSVFFKETLFSILFEETSFLNVKVDSKKIFS